MPRRGPDLIDLLLAHASADNVAVAVIAVNFVTFAAFGIDKSQAEKGGWRIAEQTLLLWAWLGGTPGAYAGRALFRHKTRKQPFSANLHAIAMVQTFALAGGMAWLMLGR